MSGPDITQGLERVGGAVLPTLQRIGGEVDSGTYQYVGGQTGPIGGGGGGVPVNSVAPAITGTAQVGQTLTSSTGTWSNTPTSYAFQWKSNGTNVGTNQNTYVPVTGDIGYTITVQVTATNSSGAGSPATSAATASVIAGGGGGLASFRFGIVGTNVAESGSGPYVYTSSSLAVGATAVTAGPTKHSAASTDFVYELAVSSGIGGPAIVVYLSTASTGLAAGTPSFQYAIYCDGSGVSYASNNGSYTAAGGVTWAPGDKFRFTRTGTTVLLQQNRGGTMTNIHTYTGEDASLVLYPCVTFISGPIVATDPQQSGMV